MLKVRIYLSRIVLEVNFLEFKLHCHLVFKPLRSLSDTITLAQIFTNGSRKWPDLAIYPILQKREYCPLVVIEVAFSETLEKLKEDIHKWLLLTEGRTKLVIAVKIDEVRKKPCKEKSSKANGSNLIEDIQIKEGLKYFKENSSDRADLLIHHYDKNTVLLKNGPLLGEFTGTMSVHRRTADGKDTEVSLEKIFYSSVQPINIQGSEDLNILPATDLFDNTNLDNEKAMYRALLTRLHDSMPMLIHAQLYSRAQAKARDSLLSPGLCSKKRG